MPDLSRVSALREREWVFWEVFVCKGGPAACFDMRTGSRVWGIADQTGQRVKQEMRSEGCGVPRSRLAWWC